MSCIYFVRLTHNTKWNTNKSRFGSTQRADGLLDAVGRAGQDPTNLPTDFFESLPKDLNGSFEYRNTPPTNCGSDTASKYDGMYNAIALSDALLGVWYSFKVKRMERQDTRPYCWEQVVSFVKYDANGNTLFVVCLDTPDSVRTALKRKLFTAGTNFAFEWHAIFLEVVRDRYNESVWLLRDCVRNAELVCDLLPIQSD
jgi:hypothetical protein